MKRSFAYFLVAAILSAMLCGCGMEDGIIYDSPLPTEAVTPLPTLRPEVSPAATADVGTDGDMTPGRNGPDTDGSSSVSSTSGSAVNDAYTTSSGQKSR